MNKVYGILLVVILCFSIFICKVSAFQYTPAPEGETVYYCGNNANKNCPADLTACPSSWTTKNDACYPLQPVEMKRYYSRVPGFHFKDNYYDEETKTYYEYAYKMMDSWTDSSGKPVTRWINYDGKSTTIDTSKSKVYTFKDAENFSNPEWSSKLKEYIKKYPDTVKLMVGTNVLNDGRDFSSNASTWAVEALKAFSIPSNYVSVSKVGKASFKISVNKLTAAFTDGQNLKHKFQAYRTTGRRWYIPLRVEVKLEDPNDIPCDIDNPDHFKDTDNDGKPDTGPEKQSSDCCECLRNRYYDEFKNGQITYIQYTMRLADLVARYPICGNTSTPNGDVNKCRFEPDLNITNNCNDSTVGNITDTEDWDCIYLSRKSSDPNVQNHYYTWGGTGSGVVDSNKYCSTYCREDVTYNYPGSNHTFLSGLHFAINDSNYNLNPLRFTNQRTCRTVSADATSTIDHEQFVADWNQVNARVNSTWDRLQELLAMQKACDNAKYKNTTTHKHYRTEYDEEGNAKRVYTGSGQMRNYDKGSASYNGHTYKCSYSVGCHGSKPNYSSQISSARAAYNEAVAERSSILSQIKECSTKVTTYNFDPAVSFTYHDQQYGQSVNLNSTTTSESTNKKYYRSSGNKLVSTGNRTSKVDYYECGTNNRPCTLRVNYTSYPINDVFEATTTKQVRYQLPSNSYRYVNKITGVSQHDKTGLIENQYYDVGYGNLPIYYKTPSGQYNYEINFTTFYKGGTHKFDKFFTGTTFSTNYGSAYEGYDYLNSVNQYITNCANNSSCTGLGSSFYNSLRSSGNLDKFLNSSCAKENSCRKSGSNVVCGSTSSFTYTGTHPARYEYYYKSNAYFYLYSASSEAWKNGYTWWIKVGTNEWIYLPASSRLLSGNYHYMQNGNNFAKYYCPFGSGATCTYEGTLYAPSGTKLDGKENPLDLTNSSYKNLASCISGATNGRNQSVTYNEETNYSCTYDVLNKIVCEDNDPTCPNGGGTNPSDPDNPGDNDNGYIGLKVVYRPIDLTDPFPGQSGNGREPGENWINNENYITNARGQRKGEDIYKLSPLYTIELNAATMKEIREYNNKNAYDDFNMDCVDGLNCKSKFVRETYRRLFSGCGLNQNYGSCVKGDEW